jgi:hypothetical protein
VLTCVLDKKPAKKLKHFDEIKMPLLRIPLFNDQGEPDINEHIKNSRPYLSTNVLSPEERFVKKAMSSSDERAKAKWQLEKNEVNLQRRYEKSS